MGLIPAHAGKTATWSAIPASLKAHPRSRGENEIARAEDVNANGSSPLTRGKQGLLWRLWPRRGLIPAHAGKTGVGIVDVAGAGAHPRSRGENGAAR